MANEIHNYSIERFVFGDDDYYDIDWFDGTVYRTAKIKGSVIKAGILASFTTENIYNTDGTLTGDRIITGSNFEILFQTIGQFIVESHKNGVDGNVIFEVRTDPTNHSFIIRDHNTNVHVFACRNGKVEISDAYFLPSIDGTAGQVMTTDGAGNVTFQSLPPAPTDTNIYNSDGTITGTRNVDGNGQEIFWINLKGQFVEINPPSTPPFNEVGALYKVDRTFLATGEGRLFQVVDQNGVNFFGVLETGEIRLGNTATLTDYKLPATRGTVGQVLTQQTGGTVTWQTPTQPWTPPHLNILDGLGQDGLTTAVNTAGAGFNRWFSGTGTSGKLHFNINLRDKETEYDGSALKLKIQSQVFGANGGGNVSWSVRYKYVNANGTANAESGSTTINTLVNVTGRTSNFLYEDIIANIPAGTSGDEMLMLTIERLTGGGTNSNIIDLIGVALTK
jgi:hypothetical protein